MNPSSDPASRTRRYLKLGGRSLLITSILVLLLVAVNWVIASNPLHWDWTENKVRSLTPETVQVLEQLEGPVQLIGFFPPELSSYRENDVRPLLHQYFTLSQGGVTYRFVDPQADPAAALQYGQPPAGSGAWLVVTYQDDFELISVPNEIEITGALVRLLDPRQRVAYLLSGHGEADLIDSVDSGYHELAQALVRNRYQLRRLNLLTNPVIPSEAQLILILNPSQNLAAAEIDLLDEHLNSGGGLVVAFEPYIITGLDQQTSRLKGYLSQRWGLDVHDDLVYEADLIPPTSAQGVGFASHEITLGLENSITLHPTASSLGPSTSAVEGIDRIALVQTNDRAWGETGLTMLETEPDTRIELNEEEDYPGPVVLAAAIENPQTFARLVIFGDTDFISDAYFDDFSNSAMFLNAVDWTSHSRGLIGLSPNQAVPRFLLPPSQSRITAMFIGVVILIPGSVMIAGGLVWWLRRRRS
jgi:hypothetical protein